MRTYIYLQILTVNADFTTYNILRLRRGTFLAKEVRIVLVFFISGLYHLAGDYMAYNDTGFGNIKMFFLQSSALIAEDLIQEAAHRVRGRPLGKPNRMWRALGRVYVLLFTSWSWSFWVRPHLHTSYADDLASFGLVDLALRIIRAKNK